MMSAESGPSPTKEKIDLEIFYLTHLLIIFLFLSFLAAESC